VRAERRAGGAGFGTTEAQGGTERKGDGRWQLTVGGCSLSGVLRALSVQESGSGRIG